MNFLYRVRNAAARFMYGRNGADQLTWALLALYFLLSVAAGFVPVRAARAVIRLFAAALAVLALLRVFSRDLEKRRAENAKFLYWWGPKRTFLRDWRYRRADKAHKYVKCACGAWCRVPRGVGKVELRCPKCGEKTIVKT
ncbi:MAG: hypothetical protein IJV43_06880 [Oscillospiraceae bacterium]|nr:hypothetical protein [Oscillospiraceae bacterium]